MSPIVDAASLEAVVGERPAIGHLKSIRFLDAHCDALLARSPLTVVGSVGADGAPRVRAVGGGAGVCRADGPQVLVLGAGTASGSLDVADLVDGAPVGALSLVPGYGETLRVNGVLRLAPTPRIEVREVFLHCAKAVIRSRLWDDVEPAGSAASAGTGLADPGVRDHLARCRFVALFSQDPADRFDDGGADVSPKGDPAGFLHVVDDRTVVIPDRPGNRRTDTLHNLVSSPGLAVLAFVAGDDRVVELRGRARVTDEPGLLEPLVVSGKVPAAAIVLDVDHAELRTEPAVAAAGVWDPSRRVALGDLPRGSRIWTDHVKLNEDPGEEADLVRQFIEEAPLAEGLEQDYANNLY
ncbi:pyridoxamine 5'-phosphate oxidase family protein [Dermatobacter hominis]|uniref:pyridoxamine 5'-phosphate oxidase family protein n=1 Tax=Dermatobacter hominis TaxID=2884263 RepID=UPI001D1179A5|nr:pyridoxamine 5'-phosphate oxidase family protein [Dermatobacter hominis]UDY37381.1 pyridoxamine 5'-phosphate oxidase family protein [Dermatobacter hominis]